MFSFSLLIDPPSGDMLVGPPSVSEVIGQARSLTKLLPGYGDAGKTLGPARQDGRRLPSSAELKPVNGGARMSEYEIRALDATTWDAFARLAEKHNGMGFGGCWCTWFHSREGRPEGEMGRPWKERLVREGKAHAALVFDGDAAVAWCQYGSPEELPRIYHLKEWEASLTGEPPAHRITCIFVDKDYRRKGVAAVAVRGALERDATAVEAS
jgi:GNAT superfamily N-acetyltransferase